MALTDVLTPRICELGKIKIGGKSPQVRKSSGGGEWRAPVKYDHFVITTLNRNNTGDLVEDDSIMHALKKWADPDGKLRRLPIAVLSHDPEEIMQASFVWYVGKKVAARSDGITLTKFYDTKGKQWLAKPEVCEWEPRLANQVDSKGGKIFKRHTVFNCVLTPEGAGRFGGVFKFRTTSVVTASQLLGSIENIKQLTGGIIRGLPLQLVVRPMQVTPNAGPVVTIYVVHCELVGDDLMKLQRMALDRSKCELLTHREAIRVERDYRRMDYKRLLLPPGEESIVEQAEIAEEFHPDEAASEPPASDPLASDLGIAPPEEEHPASGRDSLFEDADFIPANQDHADFLDTVQRNIEAEDSQAGAEAAYRRAMKEEGWKAVTPDEHETIKEWLRERSEAVAGPRK
jgi:Recombination directionality factor-like